MTDTDMISPFQVTPPKKSRSILCKVLMIVGLILGLLIPLNMIGGVNAERQRNKHQVEEEILQTWAPQQTILGPILAVPYYESSDDSDKNEKKQNHSAKYMAYLVPEKYQVNAIIRPETRYRGIYQAVVYNSETVIEGNFNLKGLDDQHINKEHMIWKEAFVVMGVSSMKGLGQKQTLNLLGKSSDLLQGLNGTALSNAGLYSLVSISGTESKIPFRLALSLKGSQSFSVLPLGKQNTVTFESRWTSPSFIGNTLPTSRQINDHGFMATWDAPYLASGYGQVNSDASNLQTNLKDSAIGVNLITPVDSYRESDRAIKYGVLFLVLTFGTYFLFEIICRHRLHPFQYLLVGCAISLFYLLLIAVSEFSSFGFAYALASLAIISVITLYSKAILGKIRRYAQWIIAGLLSILYTYLYVLLQLEDMSLLIGAIGLFIVLAIMMYVTRNIDWYSEQVNA